MNRRRKSTAIKTVPAAPAKSRRAAVFRFSGPAKVKQTCIEPEVITHCRKFERINDAPPGPLKLRFDYQTQGDGNE